MHFASMTEAFERLREAREKAGYHDATAAAEAMGVRTSTYLGHENGSRGLSRAAARYAAFFNVSLDWLLRGRGEMRAPQGKAAKVPMVQVVGYVSAGAETHFFGEQQPVDEVPAPPGATDETVAVEIRGDSLGSFFNRWLVFYDNVHRPIDDKLIGELCVVGLADGRILVKKIQRSRTKGRFHLVSQNAEPILDVEIEWAAKVRSLAPY